MNQTLFCLDLGHVFFQLQTQLKNFFVVTFRSIKSCQLLIQFEEFKALALLLSSLRCIFTSRTRAGESPLLKSFSSLRTLLIDSVVILDEKLFSSFDVSCGMKGLLAYILVPCEADTWDAGVIDEAAERVYVVKIVGCPDGDDFLVFPWYGGPWLFQFPCCDSFCRFTSVWVQLHVNCFLRWW